MKRCPECRRDYYDDTLLYCLDDGNALLEGPAMVDSATEILPAVELPSEAPTKQKIDKVNPAEGLPLGVTDNWRNAGLLSQKNAWLAASLIAVLAAAGFVAYRYSLPNSKQIESIALDNPKSAPTLYWQMPEVEQLLFIQERVRHVQQLIGDEPVDLDREALIAIKEQIDDYVEDKDSLSQKRSRKVCVRSTAGQASLLPLVSQSYEARKVPPALGIYQAMVESEYHDCPTQSHPRAPVGLFQFRRSTAAMYGLTPNDYCDVQKQCDAAAHLMSDLISDFGSEKSSWTLALFSFNSGAEQVRDYLRELRGRGITERSFWAVFRHQADLQPAMSEDANRYVPRFFAAAIIGETPEAFELSTPPLTTLRVK